MTHDAAGMAVMQHPSEWFCQVIGRIDDTKDELHNNCACFLPSLNGEVPDINVTRALSGHKSVDHNDGRLVIAAHDSWRLWREAEVGHDRSHISSMLRGGNDNDTISPVIQSTNQSRVPSSRPRTDVRPEGKDTRSNAEHNVERKR